MKPKFDYLTNICFKFRNSFQSLFLVLLTSECNSELRLMQNKKGSMTLIVIEP
jgi:hypothetical protein